MTKLKVFLILFSIQIITSCSHNSLNRQVASTESLGFGSELKCMKSLGQSQNITFGWPMPDQLFFNTPAKEVYTVRKKTLSNGTVEWVKDYGASGYIFTVNGIYQYIEPPYSGSATARGCVIEDNEGAITQILLEGKTYFVQSETIAGQIGSIFDGTTRKSLNGKATVFPQCLWTNSVKQAIKARQIESEIIKMGENPIHVDLDSQKNPYVEAKFLTGEARVEAINKFKKEFKSVILGIRASYFYKVRKALVEGCDKLSPEFPASVKFLDGEDCKSAIHLQDEIQSLKSVLEKCSLRYQLDRRSCDDLKDEN